MDAGSWFAPQYENERLVALEQFLDIFGGQGIKLELELKEDRIEEPVLELVRHAGVRDQVTITSSSIERLQGVRGRDSGIAIGLIVQKIDRETIRALKEIGGQKICPKVKQLTSGDVRLAKANGLSVRACGIRSSEPFMRYALECGVDGMTIDIPDVLASWLRGGIRISIETGIGDVPSQSSKMIRDTPCVFSSAGPPSAYVRCAGADRMGY